MRLAARRPVRRALRSSAAYSSGAPSHSQRALPPTSAGRGRAATPPPPLRFDCLRLFLVTGQHRQIPACYTSASLSAHAPDYLPCSTQESISDRTPSGMSEWYLLRACWPVAAAIRGCAGVFLNACSPPRLDLTPERPRFGLRPKYNRRKARSDVPYGGCSTSKHAQSNQLP